MSAKRSILTDNYLDVGRKDDFVVLKQLAGDVATASVVALGIAPFISIIDKSVVQRAAGTHTVGHSLLESIIKISRNPITFLRSPAFLLMWGVYGSTYATANCIKTIQEYTYVENDDDNGRRTSQTSKGFGALAFTTLVNSTTSMMKDKFYASQFNGSMAATRIPIVTFGFWGLRDCTTISSSFILPNYVGGILQNHTEYDEDTAQTMSQIICPIAAQFVATPFHMLGLDYYNRPLTNLSPAAAAMQRMKFQYENFSSIIIPRIARVAPAYCLGGVGNKYLRETFHSKLNCLD